MTQTQQTALVVYESMFGNTAAVADAVAQGLRAAGVAAECTDVARAPHPVNADLLVVGAPTHAVSLSRASTRAGAVRQGAAASAASTGLREWLAEADRHQEGRLVATFDTRVAKVRHLPAAAAPAAARIARRRGFRLVGKPTGFLVQDTTGPLIDGELDRARRWGRDLAEDIH